MKARHPNVAQLMATKRKQREEHGRVLYPEKDRKWTKNTTLLSSNILVVMMAINVAIAKEKKTISAMVSIVFCHLRESSYYNLPQ